MPLVRLVGVGGGTAGVPLGVLLLAGIGFGFGGILAMLIVPVMLMMAMRWV